MFFKTSANLSFIESANFCKVGTSISTSGTELKEPPAPKPPTSTPDNNASISSCDIDPSLIGFRLLLVLILQNLLLVHLFFQ